MSWKKYFREVPNAQKIEKWLSDNHSQDTTSASASYFQSWLPEIYTGPPNRLERYKEYENMDLGNTMISRSLDTIAEFCTQKEEKSNAYFEFNFSEEAGESEVEVLNEKLKSWTKLNEFDKRIFRIVRNTLVYGDQMFVRDPETYKWLWVDPYNVEKIIVNEAEGKKPEEYYINNPDLNLQSANISPSNRAGNQRGYSVGAQYGSASHVNPLSSQISAGMTASGSQNVNTMAVDATHVIHLSLSEGLDTNWPFGNSILENIYKAYKQVSLLEDAILIYRVHRAPERRVFYIDVGNMPTNKAMAHLERTKNEINQRKIPTKTTDGMNIVDATFNPMSLTEDYFFPQHADGRGSRVDTLPGGENLGEINDLNYFQDQLKNGLNIPKDYIASGSLDDTGTYTDGRATTALISEFRFSQYCERLQSLINGIFDYEFKLYLKQQGVNVDSGIYSLTLNIPQNFAKYRQSELDNAMINTWSTIAEIPYISKRFAMKRWLHMTEDEIVENEKMWKEENSDKDSDGAEGIDNTDGLRSMGVRPDMEGDLDVEDFDMGDAELPDESVISGAENTAEPDEEAPPPPPPT